MVFVEGTIDLYYVLVEVIFGSIFWSGIALAVVFLIIGMMTRTSLLTIIFLEGTFMLTFFSGYYDSLVMLIAFMIACIYLFTSILNYINARRFT